MLRSVVPVRGALARVRVAIIVLSVLALVGCSGVSTSQDVLPAHLDSVSLDPEAWHIFYSSGITDGVQAMSGAAWSLTLPNRGHLNYVATPYRTSGRPRQIVFSYRVVESPGAIPISYEPTASPCRDHNPCTPVAEFHIFFEQRDDDLTSECGRWWFKPGFRITDVPDASYTAQPFVADGEPHTQAVPLDYTDWTSVTGRGTSDDFEKSLNNVGYVGITFGGSDFFGHGVQVKQGSVKFELIDYRIE